MLHTVFSTDSLAANHLAPCLGQKAMETLTLRVINKLEIALIWRVNFGPKIVKARRILLIGRFIHCTVRIVKVGPIAGPACIG